MKILEILKNYQEVLVKHSTTRQQRTPSRKMKTFVTFLTFLILISMTHLKPENPPRWLRIVRGNSGKSQVVVVHPAVAPRHNALALGYDNTKVSHVLQKYAKFGMKPTDNVNEVKQDEKQEKAAAVNSPKVPVNKPKWFKDHLEQTAKEEESRTKQLGDLITSTVQASVGEVGKTLEAQLKQFNLDFDQFRIHTNKGLKDLTDQQNLTQASVESNKQQIAEVAKKNEETAKELAERISAIETGKGGTRPFPEFVPGWVGPDQPDPEQPSTSEKDPMAPYHTSFRGQDPNLIQDFFDDFGLAANTAGLTPFRQRDWNGAKAVLEQQGEPVSEGAIRSLAVREYMVDCCGMELADVLKLGEKLESTFLMKNEKGSKLAGETIWDMYCRFTDTSGRYTLWGFSAALSAVTRRVNGSKQPGQEGYLAFRVLILPPPQLESRFRKLKFLEWQRRTDMRNKGQEISTRIWFSRNDIVMEEKRKEASGAEYRIVDEQKAFPKENIPGIEFKCRTYRDYKSPSKRYVRDAGRTPPGRVGDRPDDAEVDFEEEEEGMEEDVESEDDNLINAATGIAKTRSPSFAGATPAKVPTKESKDKGNGKKSKKSAEKEKKKEDGRTMSKKRKQENDAAFSMSCKIILLKEKQRKFHLTERYKKMSKKDQRAYDAKCEDEIATVAREAAKKVVKVTQDLAGGSSSSNSTTPNTSTTSDDDDE